MTTSLIKVRMLSTVSDYLHLSQHNKLYKELQHILTHNIIQGNTLVMQSQGDYPLSFMAWSFSDQGEIESQEVVFDGQPIDKLSFDVVIGNPPYQVPCSTPGGRSQSIYLLFLSQAMQLRPRYISMIIPARWLTEGRLTAKFRTEMLSSGKLKDLIIYPDSKEVFPDVSIRGGVVYFLWERDRSGKTNVTLIQGNEQLGPINRALNALDIFVVDFKNEEIIHYLLSKKEESIVSLSIGYRSFRLYSNFSGWSPDNTEGDVALHFWSKGKRKVGYLNRGTIQSNVHAIEKWKVLIPRAGSGGQQIPDPAIGKPIVASPGSVCTDTYIPFIFDNEQEALSFQSYSHTKFFRFIVSVRKATQQVFLDRYNWVPMQSWDRVWTDEELYVKYQLTQDQIDRIERKIKSMNV